MSRPAILGGLFAITLAMTVPAPHRAAAAAEAEPDGNALYRRHCASCHQASGNGVPGMYPRIRDRVGDMAASKDGGREYLLAVLVHGLTGPITVDGRTFSGFMPSFAQLPDSEIAAILNSLGAAPSHPLTAAEIEAARAHALSPDEVGAMSPHKAEP